MALLSLHNKPEPRPFQNGWLGSGCYVAIFVVCDFFVNFRKDSYILAILVGYRLRGLFQGGTYDNFITKSCQWVSNGLFRCLPSENTFFKSALTLDTLAVANGLPQLAARQTNDILTQRLLQLYFPRTF